MSIIEKLKTVVIEVIFVSILLPAIFVAGFLTLSAADQSYLRDISPNVLLWPFVLSIIVVYATPTYILLFLAKRVSDYFKLGFIAEAVNYLFWLASMPLDLIGFGYHAICKAGGAKEKDGNVRSFISNILSLTFILALQLRQIPNAIIGVITLSILLSAVVIIVGKIRKSE